MLRPYLPVRSTADLAHAVRGDCYIYRKTARGERLHYLIAPLNRQALTFTLEDSRSSEDVLPPRAMPQIFDQLFRGRKLLGEGSVGFRLNRGELRQVVDFLGKILDLLLVGIDLLVTTGELVTKGAISESARDSNSR